MNNRRAHHMGQEIHHQVIHMYARHRERLYFIDDDDGAYQLGKPPQARRLPFEQRIAELYQRRQYNRRFPAFPQIFGAFVFVLFSRAVIGNDAAVMLQHMFLSDDILNILGVLFQHGQKRCRIYDSPVVECTGVMQGIAKRGVRLARPYRHRKLIAAILRRRCRRICVVGHGRTYLIQQRRILSLMK